ncbi:MAG: S8 family serine peptidase [Pseudonocardiaceae bacterium]|nr:S8 family serine peptidase [Pseudonocardiaceae bacterium]
MVADHDPSGLSGRSRSVGRRIDRASLSDSLVCPCGRGYRPQQWFGRYPETRPARLTGGPVPLLRRAQAVAVIAFAVAASSISLSTPAVGAPADDPADCSSPGPTLRYLVVFEQGTPRSDAKAEVDQACGTTSVYYPEIAVGVATSPDPRFAERFGTDRAFSAQGEQLSHKSRSPASTERGNAGDERELAPTDPATVPTADRSAEQWDITMIGAGAAREINPGSSEVTVGVLDSGIDAAHPDLRDAVDSDASASCLTGKPDTRPEAWAPTTSTHGTHVAGTIAAADDGKGTTGIAPATRLAAVKVVDDSGYINPEAAVCGFMWAARNGMDVTNNSFFVDPWTFTCEQGPGHEVVYEAVRRAVDYATSREVLNVAAATNESTNLGALASGEPGDRATAPSEDCRVLPAGLRDVVAVSAVGYDRLKAGYSSYGLGVIDVTAPGGDRRQRAPGGDGCVLSTVPGGYDKYCGTSMAAPHVTGVAALLAAENPGSSPEELRRMMGDDARPVACPADYDMDGSGTQDAYCAGYSGYNGFYGHGMVDALAAVRN